MNGKTSVALLSVLVLGIAAGYSFSVVFPISEKAAAIQAQPAQAGLSAFISASTESSATIYLPAIDSNGNGVALPLTVQKSAGNGETLIDINNLVFWFDTQQSIRTAKSVAENFTGKNLGRTNLVYFIDSNASVVEGPSAGAALAMATIAALENRTLAPDVMITGTVNSDGTIGEVGGILEKAAAAKDAGAKLFLVPKGQGTETFLKPIETCSEQNSLTYCTARYSRTTTDISEKAGIKIKEVSSIGEAEKYFFA
ncbi:MAG: S16 family serine protease [Candidatus Aenigmatarchaeota archaeon]